MSLNESSSEFEDRGKPSAAWTCVTCGRIASDTYCSHCGERRHECRDISIHHVLGEVVEAFFHLDSKVFLTMRTLLLRPGRLTAEYFQGRRKPYMAPLQLFLVCNLLFFVLEPLTGLEIMAPPLRGFENNSLLQPIVSSLINHRLEQKHLTRQNSQQFAEFSDRFDRVSRLQAKSLILVMVPMLAAVLALLYAGSRRFFVEHLVFSLHVYAWWLIWILAILIVMALLLLMRVVSINSMDAAATLLEFLGFGFYMFLGLRRYYRGSLVTDMARGVALMCAAYGILFLYRLILLVTVLRAT